MGEDSEPSEGALARGWTSFKNWGGAFFDKNEPEAATWWFWGCLFDAVTFISMVQAAAEPTWLVPALSPRRGIAEDSVSVTDTELALLYTGMACGIAKWLVQV